ncbi:MAG: nitrous oxide reductase accessory protein NosL [Halorubrum sp.]
MDENGGSRPTRRTVLMGVSTVGATAIAGCLGGDEEVTVDPVTIDDDGACDQCGMIVADHPGPIGQIHFSDDEPEGGRPARFCSSTCTYQYRFDALDADRDPVVTFLTDYSTVDQAVFEEGDDVLFSSHVEAGAFAPTVDLTVVAGSDVVGAMGPELIPFSVSDDVESFRDAYGGQALAAESVDRETLDGLS